MYEIDLPLFTFLLALARVSAIVMLMPGFGEMWIPARARIGMAVGLSFIVTAAMPPLPALPNGFAMATSAVIAESVAGLIFGGIMRMFLAAPQVAGQLTSQIGSLSNIFINAGMPMETSSVFSVWLMVGTIVFIFVSGLHYLMIDAIIASYTIIEIGRFPFAGDAAQQAVKVFAGVFALGVQMAVPFILLSLIFNLGIGLVNRMLPSLPVYFIAMPVSILGLIYVMSHAIAPVLNVFRSSFQAWLLAPFA